jgi:RsiW-degrading membrane proteinase PrsW (M82 family)
MPFLLSLFFGFVPMLIYAWIIYWLDRYEKEPTVLLGGVFIWGAIFAAGASFLINSIWGTGIYIFTGSQAATDLTTGSIIAPFVEESLKGLAVLAVFLFYRQEFDSYLDGIEYAARTALGFAATENVLYIYDKGYLASGYGGLLWLVFIRVILVGWQHPFYTAFIGIGLAKSRLTNNTLIMVSAPIIGWSIAILNHSIHNTLADLAVGTGGLIIGTMIDWTGWLFLLGFITWAIYREKSNISQQLKEEVHLGTISAFQYRTACSAWAQNHSRLTALFKGRFKATNRFYLDCAELAHKKFQLAILGDEKGNTGIIEQLRFELHKLSPRVQ